MAPSTSPSPARPKKPKGIFSKWKPQKLVPRLTPRGQISRRRRSSATAFQRNPPIMMESTATDNEESAAAATASPPQNSSLFLTTDDMCCNSPRPMMETNIFDDASLTPPASCPAPLIVSAKRLGNEVRRSHSSKRRRGGGRFSPTGKENSNNACPAMSEWRDSCDTTTSEDDSEEEMPASIKYLTPEEQAKQYWEWCYGTQGVKHQKSWSASRKPPVKSCLSSTKRARSAPRALHQTPPVPPRMPLSGSVGFRTPTDSPQDEPATHKSTNGKSIQFGIASAVEFETELPANVLTPLPSDVARERFPLEKEEPTEEEMELTEETKKNSAILADWEDFEDDEDSDEEEEMVFSSKRNGRRSSAFFSPPDGSTSLLLPDDEMVQDDVDSELNNMASLAVESPVIAQDDPTDANGDCEPMMESPFDKSYAEMEMVKTPAETSPSQVTEDITPPSNVQLGNVNSSGGALLSEEIKPSPREMPDNVRQLHDALEECVDDKIDIMETLLKDPNMDMEWELSTVLENMVRHAPLFVNSINPLPKPRGDFLSTLGQMEACLEVPILKTARETLIQQLETLPTDDLLKCEPPESLSTELRDVGHQWACHEWQQKENQMLSAVLDDIKKLDGLCSLETSNLDRLLSLRQLKQTSRSTSRDLVRQRIAEEEIAIAQLEEAVKKEKQNRDHAKAHAALNEAKHELESAVPLPVLSCLSLTGVAPFSVCAILDDVMEISFPSVVKGYESRVRVSLEEMNNDGMGIEGFVTTTTSADNPASFINEHCTTVPNDHIAAWFHQTLLCGGGALQNGGLLGSTCTVPLSSSILQCIKSSDLQQTVLDTSNILGRMDQAALDLVKVMDSFSNAEVSIEYDADEDTVILTVSLSEDVKIKFWYERQDDESIMFSVPTRLQVLDIENHLLEDLQQVAKEAWTSLSSVEASAFCLQTTCNAVSKAIESKTA